MGNKNSNKNSSINNNLNKQISQTLGIHLNQDKISQFKEAVKRKYRQKSMKINTSDLNLILSEENKVIEIANKIISSIYDSNNNKDIFQENLNYSFLNAFFVYNILEESGDIENFYSEKILKLNKFLNSADKESITEYEGNKLINKSIESKQIESLCSSSKNEKIIFDNFIESKDNRESIMNLRTTNPKVIESNPNLFKTSMRSNYHKVEGENYSLIKNESIKKLNETDRYRMTEYEQNNKENELKYYQSQYRDNTSVKKSKSKTRKRNYTKPPIVNIKINLRDFIRQDVLEKSFLTDCKKKKKEKPMSVRNKDPLNISRISKNKTISNVNDASFIDMVDALSQTNSDYKTKKKGFRPFGYTPRNFNNTHFNSKFLLSKSNCDPQSSYLSDLDANDKYESLFNIEERKNRIKYKNKNLINEENRDSNTNNLSNEKIFYTQEN